MFVGTGFAKGALGKASCTDEATDEASWLCKLHPEICVRFRTCELPSTGVWTFDDCRIRVLRLANPYSSFDPPPLATRTFAGHRQELEQARERKLVKQLQAVSGLTLEELEEYCQAVVSQGR